MKNQRFQTTDRVWRNVLPADAPGCSQGTPYSFWVKEGSPNKLALLLGGGGACWTGENCALHGKPHYRPFAGLELDPSNLGGVFDLDNPENPLADYTVLYLPTANGDVFLGDKITTYDVPGVGGKPAGEIYILHKGYANALSALEWMFKTYRTPQTIAVMGWSAGAIATPVYTHIVARHYSDCTITHFADGGGAYRVGARLKALFNSWGTANVLKKIKGFEDLSIHSLSFEDLYIRAAELHPEITFHQYNERHDAVQALFMELLGVANPDVAANLDEAHSYIRSKISNFRTYTSWGSDEGIIGGYYDAVLAKNALDNRGHPYALDRLYTRQADGTRFLNWFAAAINGEMVEDVTCKDSETPEHYWNRSGLPR